MKILITHPRSGSHLAARIMRLRGFTAVRKDAPPHPDDYVIAELRKGYDIWFHYPFSRKLADYLELIDAEKFVLLRDPRDIIVSIAHRVEDYPRTLVNYWHNQRRLSSYPFEQRVDALIDMMQAPFADFDNWRQCEFMQPIYFRQLLADPVAMTYTEQKIRGVRGAYKDKMTGDQKERATRLYKDLIEVWQGE